MHFGLAAKSVNYLHMAETGGFPTTVKYVFMLCYMFTLIFAKRAPSKQQNTECLPVATTCTFVRRDYSNSSSNRFQACFDGRMFSRGKSLKASEGFQWITDVSVLIV